MNATLKRGLSKVPAVTLTFRTNKILATALRETAALDEAPNDCHFYLRTPFAPEDLDE